MSPPAFDRAEMIGRLTSEEFDLLVIGGGVTGAGVALDAATRGLRVALVERDDFASGTSSRSSKLVHGGLRYLQQGDARLVRQALRERHRLTRNAPHLVAVLPFMIPILARAASGSGEPKSVIPRKVARALGSALWMYDAAGGWRIGRLHRRLRREAAIGRMPTLTERVTAAYLYYDASVDDARLVLDLARTAAVHGAVAVNRCAVVEVRHDDAGRACGAVLEIDGRRSDVRARAVVNAAGVWSDDVRALDEGADPHSLRPARGVHLTIPWDLVRNEVAVVIPVPGDRRSLFVVPWGRRADGSWTHAYVGTTDTDHDDALDEPLCTDADVDYVLRALNASLTTTIGRDDVTAAWAGLRPLVRATGSERTADLSRRHRVTTSVHGVVTVTGGKLTTYREMAQDTVDEVVRLLGRRDRCRTRRLRLVGSTRRPLVADASLHERHGSFAPAVLEAAARDPQLLEPLVAGLPYRRIEALHAARHEMVVTLDDVLSRRTRARLLDRRAASEAADDVARLIAPVLGWDDAEIESQVRAFRAACARDLPIGAGAP